MKIIHITKKKRLSYILFVLFLLFGILAFPKPVLDEGKSTVELILFNVVPSLFPFFICTYILIRTGFVEEISASLQFIMQPVFRLSGACSLCLILGLVCGYPVGAKTAAMLYQNGQISKGEAERTLGFCNNAGPLFILGTVASGFFLNSFIGFILILSHMLSALTVGILLRFTAKKNILSHGIPSPIQTDPIKNGLIADAVLNSVKMLAQIGGYILLFSALIKITDCILTQLFLGQFSLVTAPILELTNGIKRLSQTDFPIYSKILLTSLILGFGGICVYYQVKTIADEAEISTRFYLPCKFIQGLISAVYTALILKFSPISQNVFNPDQIIIPVFKMGVGKILIVSTGYAIFAIFVLAFFSFIINLFIQKPRS